MGSNDYERWKVGKKIGYKFPWVIEYYKSVTDENQHKLSVKCDNRRIMLIGSLFFIEGIILGYLLGGF